jgi:hypothetical protein
MHTQQDMPEACPYSNGAIAFPLRVLSVPSWTKKPDRSPAQQLTLGRHGRRRDAKRARCLFWLLLSLEESNQRTCGIGTHASIAATHAVGFGA